MDVNIIRSCYRAATVVPIMVCTLLFPASPEAATISFPDEMTPSLVYTSIEETNSSVIPGFTYYGGVGTSGEALTFDANNFRVESFGGVQAVDARISFTVTAKPGKLIDSITVTEGGSAAAFGNGSFVDVHSGGFVLIDGVLSGSESDSYSLSAPAVGLETDFWALSYTFEFAPATEVSISLDNAVFAFAIPEPSGYAFIDKTGVTVDVAVSPVPLPAAAWLFGSALLGLGVVKRKKA
jgi:hypothetical protein